MSAFRLAARVAFGMVLLLSTACGTLSVEDEKRLGVEAQREVRERFQLFRDRVVVNYVRKFGASLVEAADPSPFEFRFYVVEDPDLNAFAVPGGAIYVHTGLILKVSNASELAGVIAHEMAHVTARHVAQLYRRQRNTGVAAQVLSVAIAVVSGNPYIANAGQLATGVAATAYSATFSRDAEREADQLAVETLIRAGYDPRGMLTLFQTLEQEQGGGGGAFRMLSTHPPTTERMENVKADMARLGVTGPLREDDGGRLEIIQERIRLLIGTDAPEGGEPE